MSLKVAIRADASVQMGSGHVMRCLTLADALRERGAEVAFISREHPGNLFSLIEASGHLLLRLPEPTSAPDTRLAHAAWLGTTQTEDAQQTAAALRQFGDPDWLIVDHYAIDAEWQAILRPMVGRIMVIDDLADRRHDCDLLLDQNLQDQIGQTRYDGLLPSTATKLIGSKYALLRPEFKALRAAARIRSGAVERVLVFFGGGDPSNETAKVLLALKSLARDELAVDVVVGGANPHYPQLLELAEHLPACTLYRQVSNMAELMANADLSVGAGGGAMWERSCLGLPTIAISVAANQQPGCEAMAKQGAILYLGAAERVSLELVASALRLVICSPWLVSNMSDSAVSVADGSGTARVCNQLFRRRLQVRLADQSDCERVFGWRNDENTRKFFFNNEAIAWERHREWFLAKLNCADCVLLIGQEADEAIGVLRYDISQQVATVSIYLDPQKHGLGYGSALLAAGEHWLKQYRPLVTELKAEVVCENSASKWAFVKAGFKESVLTFKKVLAGD
ncbi:UDP-2,4-diacetamido-2,4,6-trideoxy-beta-L-altropyranose hydrolase [Methylomonas sp. SURF-1]|uniref:UDP-2,4-diacetamido-2,4, 6-trideoxy-beta-L-altropyranose hydrolase n=1 Tax=Methylomonas aurea TaxID=2952224 RepID=A0ABT1UDC6_9GAMM|nr:UDP-2,4-diacetamido-2,4,6-trideoxy-beta-L-altropyranose hydrolase [Methylomonas sp. SURF-1]MCQ8180226.1 UDP-2,4-diacetamido-2,4,6-trideoxy-beta-L-altropyranose hydrolase [Methylomonas sp. SURF-1]